MIQFLAGKEYSQVSCWVVVEGQCPTQHLIRIPEVDVLPDSEEGEQSVIEVVVILLDFVHSPIVVDILNAHLLNQPGTEDAVGLDKQQEFRLSYFGKLIHDYLLYNLEQLLIEDLDFVHGSQNVGRISRLQLVCFQLRDILLSGRVDSVIELLFCFGLAQSLDLLNDDSDHFKWGVIELGQC